VSTVILPALAVQSDQSDRCVAKAAVLSDGARHEAYFFEANGERLSGAITETWFDIIKNLDDFRCSKNGHISCDIEKSRMPTNSLIT
jgi:hypothetical protein